MAPTVGRLKKRPDFLRVAAAGRKWVTPGLILQIRPRTPQEGAATARPIRAGGVRADQVRVGFTVSRKVGDAVRRNRARRRLRAAAAAVFPVLGQAGSDYVVIGRAWTIGRAYADLLQDLSGALTALEGAKAKGVEKSAGPARKAGWKAGRGS